MVYMTSDIKQRMDATYQKYTQKYKFHHKFDLSEATPQLKIISPIKPIVSAAVTKRSEFHKHTQYARARNLKYRIVPIYKEGWQCIIR